jgi:hypothetical protein
MTISRNGEEPTLKEFFTMGVRGPLSGSWPDRITDSIMGLFAIFDASVSWQFHQLTREGIPLLLVEVEKTG